VHRHVTQASVQQYNNIDTIIQLRCNSTINDAISTRILCKCNLCNCLLFHILSEFEPAFIVHLSRGLDNTISRWLMSDGDKCVNILWLTVNRTYQCTDTLWWTVNRTFHCTDILWWTVNRIFHYTDILWWNSQQNISLYWYTMMK
jgi:hypothetical protein